MPKDTDDGKYVDAALSGDVNLHSSHTAEQIAAMGGEVDEDIDNFQPTAADRGDSLEPAPEPEPDKDKEEEDTGDKDEEDDADAEGEPDEGDKDSEGEEPVEGDKDGDDADEDEESEDDDGDDGKKKPEEQRIPKSRFDEVNARRKAAEDELARIKAEQKAAEEGSKEEFDFDKAEEEYTDLLLAGKTKEAAAKRREIRAADRAEWERESSQKTTQTVEDREFQRETSTTVAEYEERYAEFDPDSEVFSEDMVDEVQASYIGYLNSAKHKDLTPPQAFKLALDKTVKLYGLKPRGEEEGTTTEEKPTVRKKNKRDTKKKLEISKEAGTKVTSAGDAGDKGGQTEIDVDNLTDDEFDALPESTKAKLRGDTL